MLANFPWFSTFLSFRFFGDWYPLFGHCFSTICEQLRLKVYQFGNPEQVWEECYPLPASITAFDWFSRIGAELTKKFQHIFDSLKNILRHETLVALGWQGLLPLLVSIFLLCRLQLRSLFCVCDEWRLKNGHCIEKGTLLENKEA